MSGRELLLTLLLLAISGGCTMTESSSATTTKITDPTMKAILDHLKDNFSLTENEVVIKKLTPENLPGEVEQYYAEKKGSSGNIHYNYLVFNQQLFCSGVEGDFGRFLQTYDFLQKKDISETQLLKLFRVLQFRIKDITILDKPDLKDDNLKPYLSQLSEPKLSYSGDGGAALTFFTRRIGKTTIEKWVASIAPDYKVTVTNTPLPEG